MLITNDEQFAAFLDRASKSEVLAVDTEFMREKTYYPRLCLVQLGTDDEQVAVDAFEIRDPEPLARIFADPSVVKVLHSCEQDLEVLQQFCGVLPRPLFDTQIAAAYLGERNQIGYGALVDALCRVSLPKTESMTDWSRRPLDQAQIAYALDDVRYLPRMWRAMRPRLEARGRTAWVEAEFENLLERRMGAQDPERAYVHVKRISTLSRRQLAAAREVAAWRERRAEALDRPRRWVLSDDLLVEISRRIPTSTSALLRIRGASELSGADQASVIAACRRGLDCPESRLPDVAHHAKPSPSQECVCDLMYALTRLVAEREGIAQPIVASRDDLIGYIEDPATSPLRQGWRYEVLGRHLDELLEGRIGLTVKDGSVELL